jgi:tetratricopeptide (TPR) repeat protein
MLVIGLLAGLNTARLEAHGVGASGPEWAFTPAQRVLIAGRAVCFYFSKLIVPWPLSFNYERWHVDPAVAWQWAFPAVVLCAMLALAIFAVRWRRRGPLAGLLLFVGTLTPALGFVNVYPMRFSFVADHFQYLATIPMLALLVAIVATALARVPAGGRIGVGLAACVASLFAGLSFLRADVFHSNESLWHDTIAKSPNAWMPYDQLAAIAVEAGDTGAAVELAGKSLSLNPNQAEGHLITGEALLKAGDAAGAAAAFRKAVDLRPDNFQAHRWLAQALFATGDVEGSLAAYERVFALEPRFQQGRLELAQQYVSLGRPADAEAQLRQAIDHHPAATAARSMLAGILYRQGRVDEAIVLMQEAVALDRNNALYENNLGAFLESRGRTAEALQHYRRAAELKPDLAPAVDAVRRLSKP